MSKSVSVLPGSGKQGQAAIKVFRARGYIVHTLVRNATSKTSKYLQSLGATLHTGDLSNVESIEAALDGTDFLFFAVPANPVNEIPFAKNILAAALRKRVTTAVYSSVARAGEHESFPGWDTERYPLAWYWKNKQTIENMVRTAGFLHWTILRPAFFAQNFCRPDVEHMFPGLTEAQRLRVAYTPTTKLDVIDTEDIAHFSAAAFDAPDKFSGKEISLAAEKLTAAEIAELFGTVNGEKISVDYISDSEAASLIAEGAYTIQAQLWQRDVGYGVDIQGTRQYRIPLTSLKKVLERERF